MGPYSKLLQRPPGPLDFPHNFNPHAVNIWFAACSGLPSDTRSAWVTALQRYKEGCKSAGLLPFVMPEADTNIAIRNYLWTQRRHLVRFLNVSRLMRGLSPWHNLERHARIESYGFSILVQAQFKIEDPEWHTRLFRMPGGYRFSRIRDSERRYRCELDPGLLVFVYNRETLNPRQWFIGYEIRAPLVPVYTPGMNTGPDLRAKEQFILDELWKPLMNTYRARDSTGVRHL